MKKLFSLILIGLFMLTVIPAKATVLEKNKSEIVQSFSIVQSDDNGVLTFSNIETVTFYFDDLYMVKKSGSNDHSFATIPDSYCSREVHFYNYSIYKEKFTSNYLINKKELLSKLGITQHRISC